MGKLFRSRLWSLLFAIILCLSHSFFSEAEAKAGTKTKKGQKAMNPASSLDSAQIKEVFQKYLKATQDKDFDAMYSLVHTETREMLDGVKKSGPEALNGILNHFQGLVGELKGAQLGDPIVTGAGAEIRGKRGTASIVAEFVKSKGQWLVGGVTVDDSAGSAERMLKK